MMRTVRYRFIEAAQKGHLDSRTRHTLREFPERDLGNGWVRYSAEDFEDAPAAAAKLRQEFPHCEWRVHTEA